MVAAAGELHLARPSGTPQFVRATTEGSLLRLALVGPSGAGKTYTSLQVAANLGTRVALVDSERGSARKYAKLATFDVLVLSDHHPQRYIEAIRAAESGGYDVLIVDSLSHAWMGTNGALELVDLAAKRAKSQNSFAAWREVTPIHNALVEALVGCRCHLICTLRAKTEYVMERDEKTGKTVPRKVGLAPVQREGLEYEFDVVGDLTVDNDLLISKTRCPALAGAVIPKPGARFAATLRDWLGASVAGAPSEPDAFAAAGAPADLATRDQVVTIVAACETNRLTDDQVGELCRLLGAADVGTIPAARAELAVHLAEILALLAEARVDASTICDHFGVGTLGELSDDKARAAVNKLRATVALRAARRSP